jgi:small GTP-binding protein
MTVTSPSDLRNVALVGHQGSGKTTLAEALLHAAGVIGRPGAVPEGTTQSDYHPSEQDREMSIFTTLLHADWHGHKINILDTPGYPDFSSEVIAAMKVIDTAVYVMDARSGVEVGTELAWSYGEQMETPSMFVVKPCRPRRCGCPGHSRRDRGPLRTRGHGGSVSVRSGVALHRGRASDGATALSGGRDDPGSGPD